MSTRRNLRLASVPVQSAEPADPAPGQVCGPEAVHAHAIRLLAAGLVLASWARAGVRSVRLAGGRVEPEGAPDSGWPVDAPEAAEALVATVLLGARYRGWERAVLAAGRELEVVR